MLQTGEGSSGKLSKELAGWLGSEAPGDAGDNCPGVARVGDSGSANVGDGMADGPRVLVGVEACTNETRTFRLLEVALSVRYACHTRVDSGSEPSQASGQPDFHVEHEAGVVLAGVQKISDGA